MKRTIALAALTALTACATLPGTSARLAPGARYVAMGSSFAAGPGLGAVKPDTPERCSRSARNYATLLANKLGLSLDDQSCGGATTAHILGPWSELPPQIDAVTADTRLVTVTIGGNDLGYIMNLFAATCRPGEGFAVQGRTLNCPPPRPPQPADFARLETSLRQVAIAVRDRAPQARLIFVQYVKLVPDAPCAVANLSPEGAILNRSIGEQLAKVTARAAQAEGAEVLAADQLSRAHTPCDAVPWSIGPKPMGEGANTPWHPTAAGMRGIADALAEKLRR